MELNYLKCESIETVQPIELEFAKNNVGYLLIHCIYFGEHRSNGISTGAKGIILIYLSHWS